MRAILGLGIIIVVWYIATHGLQLNKVFKSNSSPEPQENAEQSDKKFFKASFEISIPGQDLMKYEDVEFSDGVTALDITKTLVPTKTTGDDETAAVISLNNRTTDARKRESWKLFVNGNQTTETAGAYKVKSGDVIRWEIVTP